ncbi:site-specific integrase [Photobacterium leiognathi]|uniref:hypothetical protein n=1 Tax=Photobacterium leiognathi TaxID=553611 RepID=UPI0029812F7D|nr:hypothetical protein [Photobacterium leiognathi]
MPIEHLYLNSFPEKHKVEEVDVVTLYHEGRFDALDKVIICKNDLGEVMATFGDSDWYCNPFSRNKVNYFNYLQFSSLDNHPELQRELKLFVYGWLFNKNPQGRKASKFSTVNARLRSINISYNYLAEHGFSALIQTRVLSTKLNSIESQQTLTIPERLCDAIYGKAIELIEGAHPYRDLIAQIENDLNDNYLEGKRILDEKVANGATYSFMLANGKIATNIYGMVISRNQPQSASDIITRLAKKLPDIPLNNGNDFQRYLGQLITSSYIVCGGFSGMRDSELDRLTPNSYYKDTFEGRDYHMLQSHTFKLGEKRETWVTASSSKVAIELMTVLTNRWRQEVDYPDTKYANTLWINQSARSKAPVLINNSNWNSRLKQFCKQFGFIVTEEDYQECLDSNPQSLEKVKKQVIVGEPWPMASHQFRRTLAFYCIKNRFGTMVALKQQFKHLYLAMTEWYTNGGKLASYRSLVVDEKIQAMLENINAETTANKIFKQWHSNEKLSGSHGKAIVKMRGDVPTIYSSWDVIYQAVKDGKLTLHGSLHSYCKSGYDCDMDGVVAPQFCVDCSSGSSIIDEQQAKWWQRKHSSLVAYMGSGEDISVSEKSHYITQVRAAENVMRDFDMDFVPFEAELNIVEV